MKWLAAEFMVQNSLFFNAFNASFILLSRSITSLLGGRAIVVKLANALSCFNLNRSLRHLVHYATHYSTLMQILQAMKMIENRTQVTYS